MQKISGVYKITNTVTGDFYIGSSKNIKKRWAEHKCPSSWKRLPNNQMYQDMKKYGVDKFAFEVLEVVEIVSLKEMEQQFIETLKPTYNQMNAKGWNIERRKKYYKEYKKTDKCKEYNKEYKKTDKCKEYNKEYKNQLCFYNGETITLHALSTRFYRAGIPHPFIEAKKYLLKQ